MKNPRPHGRGFYTLRTSSVLKNTHVPTNGVFEVINILNKIRKTVLSVVPNAVETVSYGIPTFDYNGKHLIHFAAFKKHVSIFPTSQPIEKFKEELKDYKTSKGTIQFPLDKEIPYDLIKKITEFRYSQLANL